MVSPSWVIIAAKSSSLSASARSGAAVTAMPAAPMPGSDASASIRRKIDRIRAAGIAVTAAPERALALRLLDFAATIAQLGDTTEPHRLCAYLFEVASLFTTFYEQCPVLKAEPETLRARRLALCALTLRVLTTGLELLGVPVPERM